MKHSINQPITRTSCLALVSSILTDLLPTAIQSMDEAINQPISRQGVSLRTSCLALVSSILRDLVSTEIQSMNQSINQLLSQSNWAATHWIPITNQIGQPLSQSINQLLSQSNWSATQSINQPITQSINQLLSQSTNYSVNQPITQVDALLDGTMYTGRPPSPSPLIPLPYIILHPVQQSQPTNPIRACQPRFAGVGCSLVPPPFILGYTGKGMT